MSVCIFKKVFFTVVAGSFYLGNSLSELQTFAAALGSATAIFAILDRVCFMRTDQNFLYVYIMFFHVYLVT